MRGRKQGVARESWLRVYGKYFSIQLRSAMQHKMSFFLMTAAQFLVSFNVYLSILFLFQNINAVEGFSRDEILVCFSVMLLSFSLAEMVARGFDGFSRIIGNGGFDRIMVRPRSEILQVLGTRIEFTRIGRMLQSVIVFAITARSGVIAWNAERVLLLFLMLLGGVAVFCGLFLIYAGICFFTLEGLEVMNVFTDGAREHGKYPIAIYGDKVLKFCTYIIPYALFQYYPFLYLVGKSEDKRLFFLPLLACLFLLPCLIFWKFGVKHYKSTGS